MQRYIIRCCDMSFALSGIICLFPIAVIIYIAGLFDTGAPLFIQKRLGKNQRIFNLIKFRSMKAGVEEVGTHLVNRDEVTYLGRFLRRSKLDELPQLWNVLIGDMSLVGPRPGLVNQHQLKQERQQRNIFDYPPGITGLGQINNIDMSTPRKLSRYDDLMLHKMNVCFYFTIIFFTIMGKGGGDVIH